MKSFQGSITVPIGKILVFSVPIKELHNCSIKAGGSLSLGGEEIESTKGLGMSAGDVAAWSWQDFRPDENGTLDIYASASVETSLTFLVWKK